MNGGWATGSSQRLAFLAQTWEERAGSIVAAASSAATALGPITYTRHALVIIGYVPVLSALCACDTYSSTHWPPMRPSAFTAHVAATR